MGNELNVRLIFRKTVELSGGLRRTNSNYAFELVRHFAFPAGVCAVLLHISQDEPKETFCNRQKMLLQRERKFFLRERR